jgi:hypothetical protein
MHRPSCRSSLTDYFIHCLSVNRHQQEPAVIESLSPLLSLDCRLTVAKEVLTRR